MRAAILLAAALLAAWTPASAETQAPSEVVDAFHFAMKAGDRRKVLELLTADVTIFEQGHIERSRTEYARTHLAEDIAFASSTQRTVARRTARLLGNAAWVMSINRSRGRFNNQPVDFSTDETMVLTRVAGKWRIVHIHWSFDDKATHN
ncbi:MAG TPA: nuclear transport factor 2 family protein [Verrucomicrobiae bacterium]|nr:nuclear transport factor 2 family protein [Verrucomicrobiae bacterium]